jgi:hypothetical protein
MVPVGCACVASFPRALERLQSRVRDLYADNFDRPAALPHGFAPRCGEAIPNETCDCFGCESIGEHESLSEAARGVGEYSERTAPFRAKSGLSERHRHCVSVRLGRRCCSRQFGRASAPTIPQRVHTMRGPNAGTGT